MAKREARRSKRIAVNVTEEVGEALRVQAARRGLRVPEYVAAVLGELVVQEQRERG